MAKSIFSKIPLGIFVKAWQQSGYKVPLEKFINEHARNTSALMILPPVRNSIILYEDTREKFDDGVADFTVLIDVIGRVIEEKQDPLYLE